MLHHLVEPGCVRLPAGEGCGKIDVLLGRERRHEVVGLEDEADAVPAQRRQCGVLEGAEVRVADEDLA